MEKKFINLNYDKNFKKKICIGIDASNIRAGGGVTHLTELLKFKDFEKLNINKIVVWSGQETIKLLKKNKIISLRKSTSFKSSIIKRIFWQIFILSKDKVVTFITMIIFLLTMSYLGYSKFNYLNIKNIQNRYSEFVHHKDNYFMNNDTINIINYLKEVTKDEKCIENFTYDLSIPYFLKKKSCTPYYSSWLASPTILQKDYIKRLKIAKPNNIIYKSKHWVDNLYVYERLELVNRYIIKNYDFHRNIDDFLIYKLKKI